MLRSVLAATLLLAPSVSPAQPSTWKKQADRVTIMRDQYGIAHVYGKSDADAVFGMVYAQAEDDFNRVETNYITAMGRTSEVEGEGALWRDLRMKLFIDTLDMKAKYAESPAWLKALMNSFADGLNYYLATHPQVKPTLLTKFEPWMALTFTEGSIGGDIAGVNAGGIEQFYAPRMGMAPTAPSREELDAEFEPREPTGSNGFAIAPKNTANGHALLLINPHTDHYFRPEIHVNSEEGLKAYGAVTWGQFFIYQGFNDKNGWMHTTGGGDVADEYQLTVTERNGKVFYQYAGGEREMQAKRIVLPYKTSAGLQRKTVTAYFSHQGPIIRNDNGKWVAVRLMQEPIKALMQSFGRTKTSDFASYKRVMELRTNSSNNTVYADASGTIAFVNGDFIPKRNPKFDYTRPVDGGTPDTEWQGLHSLDETILVTNPANGWLMNTNNWPFTVAGPNSPKIGDYPKYMSQYQEENARGIHAIRVLNGRTDFTVDKLIAAAYDSYLPAFEQIIPPLVGAWDALPGSDTVRIKLADQIAVLRSWDYRFGLTSVAMSLANAYGEELARVTRGNRAAARDNAVMLSALARSADKLGSDFGTWKTPWGEINRFQRLDGRIAAVYDDAKPSIPVPFTSSNWGSLAAFSQNGVRTTKRIYGNRGNSFIAAVEFGPRIVAKTSLAGGVSGDPASPYFMNQAEDYAKGQFKVVNYYREDVERNAKRTYHPGQ
ncbi:penicillin acylase family protein [Gemmatimonas sp.]|uniref:penicillin acylase family protein n=1 Tax=Gemmatimonas sp. TaxID=1962908 RepID=UPI00286C504C|nr:penicillin acylase family protein [Gemmatimonas sp.]